VSTSSKLNEIYQYMLVQLIENYSDVLTLFPLSEYSYRIINAPTYTGYDRLGHSSKHVSESIIARYSIQCLDTYHRCLLLHLIINYEANNYHYTKSVIDLYLIEKTRIAHEVIVNPIGFYQFDNDLFCKDIAICAHRMFPGGVFKYEMFSGVPRSALINHNLIHFYKLSKFIFSLGGFRPFYGYHLDIRYRSEFTPNGCEKSFKLAAEMLNINQNIKGIVGSSWFYDPVIPVISPRLAYLRQQLVDNGGVFFYGTRNAHATELAISSSPSRRKLFEEKRYFPTVYYGIWPRKNLINWAYSEAST